MQHLVCHMCIILFFGWQINKESGTLSHFGCVLFCFSGDSYTKGVEPPAILAMCHTVSQVTDKQGELNPQQLSCVSILFASTVSTPRLLSCLVIKYAIVLGDTRWRFHLKQKKCFKHVSNSKKIVSKKCFIGMLFALIIIFFLVLFLKSVGKSHWDIWDINGAKTAVSQKKKTSKLALKSSPSMGLEAA